MPGVSCTETCFQNRRLGSLEGFDGVLAGSARGGGGFCDCGVWVAALAGGGGLEAMLNGSGFAGRNLEDWTDRWAAEEKS